MSNWTHVAGVIRVDSLRISDIDFDKIFGKECLCDSPSEVWDDALENPDKYMPMGSEGSLQKSVWENPDRACTAAYTVTIFGDLRDHDTTSDIVEWFKEKCKSLWTRSAVITVENELNGTETYTYSFEEDENEDDWVYLEYSESEDIEDGE